MFKREQEMTLIDEKEKENYQKQEAKNSAKPYACGDGPILVG